MRGPGSFLTDAERLTRAATADEVQQALSTYGWRHVRPGLWRSPDGKAHAKPAVLTRDGRRHAVYLLRPGQADQPLDLVGIHMQLGGKVGREAVELVRHALAGRVAPTGQIGGGAATTPPSDKGLRRLTAPRAVFDLAERMYTSGLPIDGVMLALSARMSSTSQDQRRLLRHLESAVGFDGRAHVRWTPADTKSGRWRCDPPIMMLAKAARGVVRAAPGFILIEADIAAADARAVACMTHDCRLTACCRADDPWLQIGRAALPAVHDRAVVKAAFTRWVAGASHDTVTEITNCRGAYAALADTFPVVMLWRRWLVEQIRTGATIAVPTSSRQLDATGCSVGQLAARASQLVVADHVDHALVGIDAQLAAWGGDAKIVANLHDGALLEVPEVAVQYVVRLVREKFERDPYPGAPATFAVRFRAGRTWRDTQELAPSGLVSPAVGRGQ